MTKAIRIIVTLSLVALFASVFMTGCSKHPNQEQLQLLEETKQAALAAEQEVADCEKAQAEVKSQLADKKQELANVKQEQSDVSSRLAAMGE